MRELYVEWGYPDRGREQWGGRLGPLTEEEVEEVLTNPVFSRGGYGKRVIHVETTATIVSKPDWSRES